MANQGRKLFILTASIGTGHSQAARAIAEAVKRLHPEDSVSVLDFVSSNMFSIDHIIKDTYLKMIDVFPELYDHLYSDSQSSKFGQLAENAFAYLQAQDEEFDRNFKTGCHDFHTPVSCRCG